MRAQISSTKIPSAIWGLSFCAFGIGTTEFVIVGLLPTIAQDFATSISSAGVLVTLFALGVAIGGPLFTAITGGVERKKLLLATVLVFAIGNLIAFLGNSLFIVQLSRVITGVTHGVFFANAVIYAGNSVGSDKKATAISLVFAGLLISTATGVPLGTYVGIMYGWRMTFLAVAIWGALGFLLLNVLLTRQQISSKALSLNDLPTVLRGRQVLVVLFANVCAYTGTFIVFTFLTPLLSQMGFSIGETNLILLVYGIGVALGNIVGGRISNVNPGKVLVFIFIFHALILLILAMVLTAKIVVIVSLLVFGFFAFANVSALQLLVVELSERYLPGSSAVASALNVSAFNVGAAAGSYFGGLVVDSPLTIGATPWVGAMFVILAVGLALWNLKSIKSTVH
ncbi:Predicted arabinose efflux permease, MFS family [Dyadobacter soli]|uniref:Predicted arabinose efflux permease, MFS family n=1 Tax=Dyadobacter soli TaxID=659014 RepID=A0A1G7VJE0_9BACT|nr:MFS transporter [Dyadobacter soli]SDG59946.1 Predicted arabinose efflux permease, MFS family [Dyadobacter soli]